MRARTKACRAAATILLLTLPGCRTPLPTAPRPRTKPAHATSAGQPTVFAYYLVPSDRREKAIYACAVQVALSDLQNWYREAMEGITFRLADPVVRTVRLPHPAAYYSTHANGDDAALWFWNNVLDDAIPLTGGSEGDQEVRLFYVDADRVCLQTTGGAQGVAVLPANDLRGLVGEPTPPVCEGELQYPVSRYIGGSGHELGHAFGLDHPPGCDANPPSGDLQALMCSGYLDYPKTHLTQQDIAQLRQSVFFR